MKNITKSIIAELNSATKINEMSKGYNGWTNYETWLVNLHYGDHYMDLVLEDPSSYPPEAYELGKMIKDYIEDNQPQVNGFWNDVINSAISEVNFTEIAQHIVDEL